MKGKTTKIALWSMLFAMALPLTSQAVDYELKVTRQFYATSVTTPGATGKSAAASTNKIYVAPTDATDLYYEKMASTCSQATIASGYSSGQLGSAIANDESGNIVFHAGEYWASGGPTKFTILPAGATAMTNKKEITITSPGGRCDFIRATGNLLSGTGYIWFAVNGTQKVVAAKVTNGAFVSNTTYTVSGMSNNFNTLSSAYKYASNKMLIHNQAEQKLYDCTISGTTVTATEITAAAAYVSISGNYWKSNAGAIMFELRGHKVLVRNNSTQNQGTNFAVVDMTDGKVLNTYATWGDATTGAGGTGSWASILKVSDDEIDVYVYAPKSGFGKYVVKATATGGTLPTSPVQNLNATLDESNNASVSWVAPNYDSSVATLTGYTITVGSASPITVAASVTSYNLGVISSSTTFTIAPNYALISDPSTTGSGTAQSVTIKPAGNVGPPTDLQYVEYEGRSLVDLSWKRPASQYDRPDAYNVYRDGVLIMSNQATLQFVDSNVSAGRHEYTVASVYNGTEYPNCSTSINVTVGPFNTANNVYKIEEIYNYTVGIGAGYDISATIGGKEFNSRDMWRQGAVYNGKWYVAMGGASSSPDAGIYMFDLNDPRQTPQKLSLNPAITIGQTNGIAFDEAGNIVVRNKWSTTPNSNYDIGVGLWNVTVYKRNSDGSYATGKTVDISSVGHINTSSTQWHGTDIYRATGFGRVDYYTLKGNIFSSTGAKFPIAITQKKLRVDNASGETVTNPKNQDFALVTLYLDGSNVKCRGTAVTLSGPFRMKNDNVDDKKNFNGRMIEECFAFYNAANPSQIIIQSRSDGYAVFNESDLTSNGANGEYIYNKEGATSNSGGTTILWGNDLLFINPYDLNSANVGTFRIGLAINQDLTQQVPLMNVVQNEHSSNIAGNSNGSWIYAEKAVDNDGEECIYIYNYTPATRFAKYKLTRSGTYSFPEPEIEIEPEYGTSDNNPEKDLIRYNATLLWERPKTSTGEYWPLIGDNPLVKYRVSVVDKNDNPYTDADGTVYNNYEVTAANTPSFAESWVELPLMKDFADNEPYTIKVKAVYDFSGKEKESFERTATSRFTYEPVAPQIDVMTYVKPAAKIDQEWVWDGQSHIVPFYYDIYRIEIALDRPEGYDENEPVSFYTVEVSKDGGETWEPIKDQTYGYVTNGYNGASTVQTTYGEKYEGDYDFVYNQTQFHPESMFNSNIAFYYYIDVTNAVNTMLSESDEYAEDPLTWLYRATAHYGSSEYAKDITGQTIPVSTKGIAKSADNIAAGETVPTGVAIVGANPDALVAYPNPAVNILNVKAGQALGSIDIYSVAGALVKKVNTGKNNAIALDVTDLAAGVYYLRAAGQKVAIIKK